nr:hypothetical protein [Haliscomenobacter sp.]
MSLPPTPPLGKKQTTSLWLTGKDLLRDRSFMVLLIALTLICIPNAFYYSFVNAYLKDQGFKNAAAMMSIGQATEIAFCLAVALCPALFWPQVGHFNGCFRLGHSVFIAFLGGS